MSLTLLVYVWNKIQNAMCFLIYCWLVILKYVRLVHNTRETKKQIEAKWHSIVMRINFRSGNKSATGLSQLKGVAIY